VLQDAVHQWLQRRDRNFHWAEKRALVQKWKRTVDKDGDYTEQYAFGSVVVM
jgi:hypothetical protein